MTVLDPSNFDLSAARVRLTERLERFDRRGRLHLAMVGAATLIAEAAGLLFLSFFVDRYYRLGVEFRVTLLLAMAAFLAFEAWRRLIAPVKGRRDLLALAAAYDGGSTRSGKAITASVATVLQSDRAAYGTSLTLLRAAVERADRSLADVDFDHRLDTRKFKSAGVLIAGIILVLLLLAICFPNTSGLWARRWFAASNEPWPQKTYLKLIGLMDGNLLVPRGEPAMLRVQVVDGSTEPEVVSLRLRPKAGKRTDAIMDRFAAGDFRRELPPVVETIEAYIEGGDAELGPVLIEPVDRPTLVNVRLTTRHPRDAKPVTSTFNGETADAVFLPQTGMELVLQASLPAQRLLLGESPPPGASVQRIDARSFKITWTHQQPVGLQIAFVADRTALESTPVPLSIGLKKDLPPRVRLAYRGVRSRITPRATLPLEVDVRDDYGVANIDLASALSFMDADQKAQTQARAETLYGPVAPATELELQTKRPFAVEQLKAPVGAMLTISLAAKDDCFDAPQTTKSKETSFRIVAPEELFREILLRQQGERAKLRKATDEATRIRDELPTTNRPVAAAALGRRHRAMQREIARIQTSLTDSLTEMRLNALGSQEAYDLMERSVLTPLASLDKEQLLPQRNALDAFAAAPASAPPADMIGRQQEIVDRLNQVLKQMAQWDSFVDVLNQLNEIIRLQENAKQAVEKMRANEAESVFDK